MLIINNDDYYDLISEKYPKIYSSRSNYLKKVDDIILKKIKNINSMLDIGSGDGQRTKILSESLGIESENVNCVESSHEMYLKTKIHFKNVFNENIVNFNLKKSFDLVTCLWNVFGHIEDEKNRISVLKKVENFLNPGGYFVLDINNRYNINSYGIKSVIRNIFYDIIKKKDRGIYYLKNNEKQHKVYIHNPIEFKKYLKQTNLKLIDELYIEYNTGQIKNTLFEGQCLYILRKTT